MIRKKIFLFPFLVLAFAGCSSDFMSEIVGTTDVKALDNKYVYLQRMENGVLTDMDSAFVRDGKFFFREKSDSSGLAYLSLKTIRFFGKSRPLLLERGKIYISLSVGNVKVYGTPANESYQRDFLNMQKFYRQRLKEIETEYKKEKRDSTFESRRYAYEKRYNEIYDKVTEAYTGYLVRNIGNALGQEVFGAVSSRLNESCLEAVLKNAGESFLSSRVGRNAVLRLNQMKSVSEGRRFVDFSSMDPYGKIVRLSDYAGKGKYLLVCFWASWSIPCQKDRPTLMALYDQYKNNLDIAAVSLDRDPLVWGRSIRALGMPWIQLSDFKSWRSEAARVYVLRQIPYYVLVDPSGKIVSNSLNVRDLYNKLNDLLSNNNQNMTQNVSSGNNKN